MSASLRMFGSLWNAVAAHELDTVETVRALDLLELVNTRSSKHVSDTV